MGKDLQLQLALQGSLQFPDVVEMPFSLIWELLTAATALVDVKDVEADSGRVVA